MVDPGTPKPLLPPDEVSEAPVVVWNDNEAMAGYVATARALGRVMRQEIADRDQRIGALEGELLRCSAPVDSVRAMSGTIMLQAARIEALERRIAELEAAVPVPWATVEA